MGTPTVVTGPSGTYTTTPAVSQASGSSIVVTGPSGTYTTTPSVSQAPESQTVLGGSSGTSAATSAVSVGVPVVVTGPSGTYTTTSGVSTGLPVVVTVQSSTYTTTPGVSAGVPLVIAGPSGTYTTTPGVSAVPSQQSPGAIVISPSSTAITAYPTDGPHTISPISTDSNTVLTVPTSIVTASVNPTGPSSTQPTGLPTDIPLTITPPGNKIPAAPKNTTLIQVAFNGSLPYEFVLMTLAAQQQIWYYLPIGIAYDLNCDPSDIVMHTIEAHYQPHLDYLVTAAVAYIPADKEGTLSDDYRNPVSKLYENPDASTRELMAMIDPNMLPLSASESSSSEGGTGSGSSPSGNPTAVVNEGAPLGSGSDNSAPVKGTSVGIGVGVVCGAAAYGAAMFFVARRYRKRRQAHTRSPSMLSPVTSHSDGHDFLGGAGTALMSGGRGDGVRSTSPGYGAMYGGRDSRGSGRSGASSGRQQISAPVMAENSLGWN